MFDITDCKNPHGQKNAVLQGGIATGRAPRKQGGLRIQKHSTPALDLGWTPVLAPSELAGGAPHLRPDNPNLLIACFSNVVPFSIARAVLGDLSFDESRISLPSRVIISARGRSARSRIALDKSPLLTRDKSLGSTAATSI